MNDTAQSAGAVNNQKRKEKKKLKLVDKMITPSELVLLLKEKLNKFPVHRFIVEQTAKTYDKSLPILMNTPS